MVWNLRRKDKTGTGKGKQKYSKLLIEKLKCFLLYTIFGRGKDEEKINITSK